MASETFYVDELLKAEEEGNKIIKAAQKERYAGFEALRQRRVFVLL